jgi:hypothetical protein
MRLGPSLPALATLALAIPLRAQGNPAVDSAVAAALRTAAAPEIEFVAAARPLGDGRYAAIAARARRMEGAPVTVLACVATDSAGTWHTACVTLLTPRIDANLFAAQLDSGGWQAGDLDNDGATELLVGVSYTTRPQPAVGPDTYTKYYAIELAPRPRVARTIDAGTEPGSSFIPIRRGRVRVADSNGDGHGDLVLEGRSCADRDALEQNDCRPVRTVWTWSTTRGWIAAPAAPAAHTAPSRRPS